MSRRLLKFFLALSVFYLSISENGCKITKKNAINGKFWQKK